MSNKNLFKEAIADAKAVREAALANAKAALEEALTPKLQSMLAAKLNEMDYDMEEEGMKSDDEMEEGMYPEDTSDEIQDRYRATGAALEEDELEEDFDLSEILAELNDEEELKEAKEEKEEAGEEAEDESEEDESEEEEPTEEEDEEEVEVKDMTIEDLKDLIKDIVSQEIETETPADEEIAPVDAMYGEMGPDVNAEEDEINLEELLAELDSLNEAKEKEKLDEIEPISLTLGITAAVGAALAKYLKNDAMKVAANKLGKQVNELTPEEKKAAEQAVAKAVSSAGRDFGSGAGKSLSVDETKEDKEEKKEKMNENIFDKFSAWAYDTNLDNIKACKDATKGKGIAEFQKCLKSKGVKMVTSTTTGIAENEDLAEAIETINTLRTELNETNLLNAKLLYVNKIFKAKNLTESQKLKVIASFDKATNVKEAKVVFESLNSALSTAPKKAIKESLGFASKAAGVAPNKTIVESNDVITRMQKLANIK